MFDIINSYGTRVVTSLELAEKLGITHENLMKEIGLIPQDNPDYTCEESQYFDGPDLKEKHSMYFLSQDAAIIAIIFFCAKNNTETKMKCVKVAEELWKSFNERAS